MNEPHSPVGTVTAPHSRRWRRVATVLLLLYLAGPAVSVLVAWACAAWVPTRTLALNEAERWEPRLALGDDESPQGIGTARSEGFGVSEYQSSWIVHIVEGQTRVTARPRSDPPNAWPTRDQSEARSRIVIIAMPAGAAGWPARCVYWQGSVSSPPTTGLGNENSSSSGADPIEPSTASLREQGVIVPPLGERVSGGWYQNLASLLHQRRPLPVVPLWPGLAMNSAFWGVLLVLAVYGPAALRRWARSRRGDCLSCGYALAGARSHAVCPECGSPTTRAANARGSAQSA